ncbi:MAG TPA: glycoside hydrolase family 127 protein [Polyangiaceae bacterium]|nr:glycoside hydrolase family 127 protein [Polyangiaceae bacterium]
MPTILPVPFTRVALTRGFWAERLETNRASTIPTALTKCEDSGRFWNFERAAAALRGEPPDDVRAPGYPFDDTDVYKVVEGAAYALAVRPDAVLDARLDAIAERVARAQEPDGYLFTTRTLCPAAPHHWAGSERWQRETDLSHELYNIGHLIEAAVAHQEATGKRSWLAIAERAATLLTETFGPGRRSIWPGHQIIEMALVRLHRVTGDRRLLELARFLLDERGPDGKPQSGDTNNQSHARVVEQSEAVGHAVRAMYMYAGMADVALERDAADYVAALDRLWHDVVARKLYVTGGIGARHSGEAFGAAYELPNLTAYNETCAAIGLVYFSQRMFLLHGHASAADVLERVLFNGLIAGVSLDGTAFFYPNPLESFGEYTRSPWFGCACCPGNVARFLASVAGYVCAEQGDRVYLNLYAHGRIALAANGPAALDVDTDYPWDGGVRITLSALAAPREMALSLRIPGWARGEVVPSDLYRFLDEARSAGEAVTLAVNGAPVPVELEAGYVTLRRVWREGDVVTLQLPMPVRRVVAHPNVEADRDRVALQRGPLVYALEGGDQRGGEVLNLVVADDAALGAKRRRVEGLGELVVIEGSATALAREADGTLRRRATEFTAIPYFAWANRGAAEMQVWLARREASAWVRPAPTLASSSQVSASGGEMWRAANDQATPASSRDESHRRTRLLPDADGQVWIEYAFPEPASVSEANVYWFESTDWRREGPPVSWRLLHWDGATWAPVRARDAFGVERNRFNPVRFQPVVTSRLRLEAVPAAGGVVALSEWEVH